MVNGVPIRQTSPESGSKVSINKQTIVDW